MQGLFAWKFNYVTYIVKDVLVATSIKQAAFIKRPVWFHIMTNTFIHLYFSKHLP